MLGSFAKLGVVLFCVVPAPAPLIVMLRPLGFELNVYTDGVAACGWRCPSGRRNRPSTGTAPSHDCVGTPVDVAVGVGCGTEPPVAPPPPQPVTASVPEAATKKTSRRATVHSSNAAG